MVSSELLEIRSFKLNVFIKKAAELLLLLSVVVQTDIARVDVGGIALHVKEELAVVAQLRIVADDRRARLLRHERELSEQVSQRLERRVAQYDLELDLMLVKKQVIEI